MKRNTHIPPATILRFFTRAFVCTFFIFLSISARSQNGTLTVISNTNGAPSELKMSDLKSIFLGEKQRWRNGKKISIALMKTSTPAGMNTCKKIYDMSSDELKKFWLALVFEGKAEAPVFFNTASELENFVAENPGAIGITDQPPASAETHVVLVDGKKMF